MLGERSPRGSRSHHDRGQLSLDFLFGLGIFITTFGFIALVSMGMVTPYTDDQARPLVANRVADDLVGTTIADPGESNSLNEACTLAFFGGGSDAGCSFDSADLLTDRVGVSDRWDLNVTVERNAPSLGSEILCLDGTATLQSCTMGGTRLASGDRAPVGSDSIVTTSRLVMLDGQDVVVVVRLW